MRPNEMRINLRLDTEKYPNLADTLAQALQRKRLTDRAIELMNKGLLLEQLQAQPGLVLAGMNLPPATPPQRLHTPPQRVEMPSTTSAVSGDKEAGMAGEWD